MALMTYRGEVTELQGKQFDVPAGVPISQAAAWIESQQREQLAREAAAAAKAEADREAQVREAELLAARIEAAKSGEEFRSDLSNLQAQITEVREQLEAPDVEGVLAMHASTMTAFATAREVLQSVDEAIVKAETLQTTAAELLAEAEAARAASIQIAKNEQELINGAFSTYGLALEDLQQQVNDASTRVGELNAEATENRDLIRTASQITETAIDIAGQEAKKAVNEGMDEMLALLSLALEVMGIDETQLNLQLSSDELQPNSGVYLTREYLRRVKDIHTGKGEARDASITGPLV